MRLLQIFLELDGLVGAAQQALDEQDLAGIAGRQLRAGKEPLEAGLDGLEIQLDDDAALAGLLLVLAPEDQVGGADLEALDEDLLGREDLDVGDLRVGDRHADGRPGGAARPWSGRRSA